MAAFSTTQTLPAPTHAGQEISVTVEANGGTLSVQRAFDGDWLEIDSLTEDGTTVYEIGLIGAPLRFVPASGATFEFGAV